MDLTNLKIPELLAPGGGPAKARTAILYGADAVYVGGQGLNLRAKAAGFTWDDLDFLLAWAHKRGARVYYCLNAMIRAQDLSDVESSLECLGSKDVDGLIAADPGIIRMARKHAPHIPLHLSTQVSTSNPEAALLWRDLGISRVNLARELSLQEIRPFSSLHGILETELFVHGALCMAVSGRCLLSAYLNARPANLGLCTHPCRYEYRMVRMSVEERKRKGEILWEIEEQDDYTRLFAAKDLCLLPYLKWICSARISALKIEGRMKSVAYLSQVVDVYRTALQAIQAGSFQASGFFAELERTATRDLTSGMFLKGREKSFVRAGSDRSRSAVLARVGERVGPDAWNIHALHGWRNGEGVRVMLPGLSRPPLGQYGLEDCSGEQKDLLHPGMEGILRTDNPDLKEGYLLMRSSF